MKIALIREEEWIAACKPGAIGANLRNAFSWRSTMDHINLVDPSYKPHGEDFETQQESAFNYWFRIAGEDLHSLSRPLSPANIDKIARLYVIWKLEQ